MYKFVIKINEVNF